MKNKRPILEMLPVALGLCDLLGPCCTRIAIGGSIRRGVREVSDVEIVCEPAGDLLEVLLADWLRIKRIEKRLKSDGSLLAWGERYKAFVLDGVPVDVFMVLGDRQWGPTYLIRTGPGEANDSLVTQHKRKNSMGRWGVLPEGMVFREGAIWQGGRKLDTPEEADCFQAVGLPYVPPHWRSYQAYQALRWKRGQKAYPADWRTGDDYFVNGERRLMAAPVFVGEVAELGGLEQGRLL